EQPIVLPVLDDLGRPSGDSGDGEDRGEQVRGDPEAVEDEPGIEVYVRVDVFRGELPHDRIFDRGRDPVIRVIPVLLSEATGVVLQDERPRVVGLVHAMTEPEDLL